MEESSNAPVEQSQETSGSEVEAKKEDLVPHSTYKKVLSEKRNYMERYGQLESELQALKEEKMRSEGKTKELADTYKAKYEEAQKSLEETRNKFAWNALTNTIKAHSQKHGCKDPDGFIKLLEDEDLKRIEVGEDFSIDTATLDSVFEDYKNKRSYIFESPRKPVANGNPTNTVKEKEKDLKKMSLAELKDLYKNL